MRDELPWVPPDLAESLLAVTSYLRETLAPEVSRIGLYGSWQRGDASPTSDVDIVVLLDHSVPWFDATNGITNRRAARRDRSRWHAIEARANALCLDARGYSIAVVTQDMLDYYAARGPIHLQNWAYAVEHCFCLWQSKA